MFPDQPEKLPRFAVCLAAFNGTAYIGDQIASILTQNDVDLQLFISVDASTDGTENFIAKSVRSEPRLTLLPVGRHFGGAGPNFYRLLRDVDLSGFDYLSFADQDDLWHQDKLVRAHNVLTATEALGYSSNFTAFWPSGKTRLVNKSSPQQIWDFLFESAGPGCTYVLHHRLALALQAFVRCSDQRLLGVDYHDWLAYAFARFNGFPWVIDGWSSMRYRQHPHNQLGVNTGLRSFWLRAGKVMSGYGFDQSLLIADLIQASSQPIVQRGLRGGRQGYLWLALQARQCRRKRVDQLFFFLSCVMLACMGPPLRGGR